MRTSNHQGFTLVEVLISTAILVSVFGALAYAISQCSGVRETARNSDIALNAAQEKLEEIADSNIDEIMDYNSQDPQEVNNLLLSSLDPTVTEVVSGELYNVTVTVSWYQSGAEEMSRTITTTFVQK